MKRIQAMQEALDIAWENPEGAEFRAQLFPEGKPTLEQFLSTVSTYLQQERAN